MSLKGGAHTSLAFLLSADWNEDVKAGGWVALMGHEEETTWEQKGGDNTERVPDLDILEHHISPALFTSGLLLQDREKEISISILFNLPFPSMHTWASSYILDELLPIY